MSDSPYELQRLVTVRTFSTPWEAQIAQARLGSEGVHSLIANEHVIRMVALSNAVGGIQLKVREQDAEAAAAVLERLAPLPEIYLVGQDAAAVGAPSVPSSPPADAPAPSPSGVAALQPAGVPALPPAGAPPPGAATPPASGASRRSAAHRGSRMASWARAPPRRGRAGTVGKAGRTTTPP